jgi:hypothetical protein
MVGQGRSRGRRAMAIWRLNSVQARYIPLTANSRALEAASRCVDKRGNLHPRVAGCGEARHGADGREARPANRRDASCLLRRLGAASPTAWPRRMRADRARTGPLRADAAAPTAGWLQKRTVWHLFGARCCCCSDPLGMLLLWPRDDPAGAPVPRAGLIVTTSLSLVTTAVLAICMSRCRPSTPTGRRADGRVPTGGSSRFGTGRGCRCRAGVGAGPAGPWPALMWDSHPHHLRRLVPLRRHHGDPVAWLWPQLVERRLLGRNSAVPDLLHDHQGSPVRCPVADAC